MRVVEDDVSVVNLTKSAVARFVRLWESCGKILGEDAIRSQETKPGGLEDR